MAEENYRILGSTLSSIANAVRDKTGRTDPMYPTEFAEAINSISVGTNLEILEGVPVEPDFSEGDFEISVPEGYAVKSAIVQKPDTLKPENILSGVNIAGIIGAAVAGGGSGSGKTPVWKSGTFQATSTKQLITVTHGLGCRPDLIAVWGSANSGTNQLLYTISFSQAFANLFETAPQMYYQINGNHTGFTAGSTAFDASPTRNQYLHDMYGGIFVDDDTTFDIGSPTQSNVIFKTTSSYNWIAIGGLT